MPFESLQKAFMSRLSEPKAKRHGAPIEILPYPASRLELGLLDHIGHVHARGKTAVKPDTDHTTQVAPILLEELIKHAGLTSVESC
jgi:hypothetical protein